MTGIDVHFNMSDKLDYACRLLRKAVVQRGVRMVALAEPRTLAALDAALWALAPSEFVAHCRHDAAPEVLARSPVVLVPSCDVDLPHTDVLLNLGSGVPEGFERFGRVIDIVGDDEAERQAGRQRWVHYRDRGHAITRHDVGNRGNQ